MKNSCWMIPTEQPPCFIILGRYGDIIQLCPAFRAVKQRTGLKPIVIVSTSYANVLDGVSYVQPFPVHWEWWTGVPQSRRLAAEQFGGGIVCQWWHDSADRIALIEQANSGGVVLQSHGLEWGVDINRWPNYGTSMWDRAGFTVDEMMALPLVFDRRDAGRETVLVNIHRGRNPKPMLLVSFFGHSSPFAYVPEVMAVVNRFAGRFNIVDLGHIKAARIYDLLGLMDAAAGMITIDTASLHLALATKLPYVAYTRSDWCRSVPKGNCVREIRYHETQARLNELEPVLEQWAAGVAPQKQVPAGGGGGGVLAV